MTSALHKRLQRLEELMAARVAPPIYAWQMDPEGDTAAELDRLVAEGIVAERDRGRVKIWRWLTREEAIARGEDVPEPWTPPQQPQPQLPAPPELKLLPAPAHGINAERQDESSVKSQNVPKPDPGKRPWLTAEELRRSLE